MKNASFLILLFILIGFLPFLFLKTPENETKITGNVTVYNHLTGQISEMKLEDYTARCLASEMPASFHFEALKAQAVAIRSYTLSKKPSEEHKGARVCTDFNHCMAYLQSEQELLPVFCDAARETENQVLIFEGQFANTVFHAMSSGKTENAEDVWGGYVPYLTSVDCAGDKTLENFETVSEFTWEQLSELLEISEKGLGEIKKSEAGGVKTIRIGEKTFKGGEIRKLLNFRSLAFDTEQTVNGLRFKVHGYGHGVGMSQYGADCFARSGMSYKEILAYFYKGTELISIDFGA